VTRGDGRDLRAGAKLPPWMSLVPASFEGGFGISTANRVGLFPWHDGRHI